MTNRSTNPLATYGVSLKGPKGTINRYYPSTVYHDGDKRNSTFFDVTSFVKSQGYGTYTGINIPYMNMAGNTTKNVTGDMFGSWKIIAIEEDVALPTRQLQLVLGGTDVSKGASATAQVSGSGLYVAPGPTGETLVSNDGSDWLDSKQYFQYYTDKTSYYSKMSFPSSNFRPESTFFSFHVDIDGKNVAQNPGPSITNKGHYTVDANKPFYACNTDLTVMSINNPNNSGSMKLSGGEQRVVVNIDTKNNPTILSALGLAVDIIVPEFKTTMYVANRTKHYASNDPGYLLTRDYAEAGDRLRATVHSVNVSKQEDLGLQGATFTITLPAFANIDRSSVNARYVTSSGSSSNFEVVNISGNTLTVRATSTAQIKKGGYFEVTCEGTAKGSASYTTYTNTATVGGIFVDKNGAHASFQLDSLGNASCTTSSDRPKYDVTVSTSGNGIAGITSADTGLTSTANPTTTASYYGDKTAYVGWIPAEDKVVRFVMVDGVVRDDLIVSGKLVLPVADADHQVFVAFGDPADPPTESPFTIATKGDAGVKSLTPTATVDAGASHEVSWQVAAGREIAEVLIDGVPIAPAPSGTIPFQGIDDDHLVEVRTTPVPDDRLEVRTIVRGPGTISSSTTVKPGDNHTVTWAATNGAILNYVKVNGVVIFDKNLDTPTYTQPRPSQQLLENIQENQTVEVEFIDSKRKPTDPPNLMVRTELIGGRGTISPSVTVAPGGNASVNWSAGSGYEIQSIIVMRGTERTKLDPATASVALSNITTNCLVQVILAERAVSIETALIGAPGGFITPSEEGIHHGEDRTVTWTMPPGHTVSSVTVDGVVRDDLLNAGSLTFENLSDDHTVVVVVSEQGPDVDPFYLVAVTFEGAGTAGPSANVRAGGSHTVTWSGAGGVLPLSVKVDGVERPDLLDAGSLAFAAIGAHHTVHVVFPESADETFIVTARITGGPGSITGAGVYAAGSDASVAWIPAAGWRVKSVTVDGAEREDLADTGVGSLDFTSLNADHDVVVELVEDFWRVDVSYTGNGVAGASAIVAGGATHPVTWEPDDGHEVLEVLVDGVARPDLIDAGQIVLTDIRGNHQVHVRFSQDPPEDDQWRDVSIALEGGPGETSGSGRAPLGSGHEVQWSIEEGWHVVSVTVDGDERPDLINASSLLFENVQDNHRVVVRIAREGEDVSYTVRTQLAGATDGCSITPTENGIAEGESRTVTWTVPAGHYVSSVTVDGVIRDDLLNASSVAFDAINADHSVVVMVHAGERPPSPLFFHIEVTSEGAGSAGPSATLEAGADHRVTWAGMGGVAPLSVTVDGVDRPDLIDAGGLSFHELAADHTVHVVFPDPNDLRFTVATAIVGGPGTITGSATVSPGTDCEVEWAPADGWRVKRVTVDGVDQSLQLDNWGFSAVQANHRVEVEVELDLWRVDVTYEGSGTAGDSALVRPGADHWVTWSPEAGQHVVRVVVDGEERPDLIDAGGVDFSNIEGDHTVHVEFSRDEAVDQWYQVSVSIEGGPGTVSGTGSVAAGADREVHWTVGEGFHVAKVIVDGVERPDLIGEDGLLLENIQGNHQIVVVLGMGDANDPEGPDDPDDPDDPDGPDDPIDPVKPEQPDGPSNPDDPNDPDGPHSGDSDADGTDDGRGRGRGWYTLLPKTGDQALVALVALTVLGAACAWLALRLHRRRA
ncbi:hypothetical protein VIN30_02030 [Adlercreutzia sp. R7]|uniref:Uncharacterized protein n=1 Tax=Adlercreutzia wanghongyangiae TaxID=3111451 RepID=A0ABU6IFK0_9ACTN|nr:hypothetical protein [Adlercreutzia sp. R7]